MAPWVAYFTEVAVENPIPDLSDAAGQQYVPTVETLQSESRQKKPGSPLADPGYTPF